MVSEMSSTSPFAESDFYNSRNLREQRGVRMAAEYEEGLAEGYRGAHEGCALFDRSDRGLLEVTGSDRKAWLHNLVTNAVTTLDDNSGNYAFAADVKGRILFDLNILCLPDALWLDIDLATIDDAVAHLERFLITEDVQIRNVTEQYARLGVAGPNAGQVAKALGVGNFPALPTLAHVAASESAAPIGSLESPRNESKAIRFIRHDFAGLPGFEWLVTRKNARVWWDHFVDVLNVTPASAAELDALRIEAGIPWLGRDIDERTTPPETGQIERGIDYHKGCYLGQEVVERMRSHNVLPRSLVRLRAEDGSGLELPTPLRLDGREVGRVTSLMKHPIEVHWIGLGYLKTGLQDLAGLTCGEPGRAIGVVA